MLQQIHSLPVVFLWFELTFSLLCLHELNQVFWAVIFKKVAGKTWSTSKHQFAWLWETTKFLHNLSYLISIWFCICAKFSSWNVNCNFIFSVGDCYFHVWAPENDSLHLSLVSAWNLKCNPLEKNFNLITLVFHMISRKRQQHDMYCTYICLVSHYLYLWSVFHLRWVESKKGRNSFA